MSHRRPDATTLAASAVALAALAPVVWILGEVVQIPPGEAVAILTAERTLATLARTGVLVAGSTAIATALGVTLAVAVTWTDLPGRRAWTVALAVPLVVPSYLGAFAYLSAGGANGLLARLTGIAWPSVRGLPGATVVIALYVYPYVFLSTRARLLALADRQVEAARTLGDGPLATIRRIAIPQARSATLAGALLVALYALSDFGTPAILRVDVLTRVIYVRFGAFARAEVALLSLQLLAIAGLILVVSTRIDATAATTVATGTTDPVIELGQWRWPATLGPLAVVAAALVVPVGVLLMWLVQPGLASPYALPFEWTFAATSVGLAVGTALIAVVVALPVAVRAARGDRLGTALDRISHVGWAIPGIVLAFAIATLALALVGAYRLVPLLIGAYLVRFLPQAVGTIRASIAGIDDTLQGAGRTLGDPPGRVFRRVTLPLIWPGIAAGAGLVGLTTMKELPATLLLAPAHVDTLVTYIWAVREAGLYGRAAIPALALIGLSALSMGLVLARDRVT
ncbi:MAG: ABC transporter permease [Halococcoides sp.]